MTEAEGKARLINYLVELFEGKGIELVNVSQSGYLMQFRRPDEKLRVKMLAEHVRTFPPNGFIVRNFMEYDGEAFISMCQDSGRRQIMRRLHLYARQDLLIAALCY